MIGWRVALVVSVLLVMSIGMAWGQDRLPAAPLRLFDGTTLDLRDLKDQVVVIRFLASW
ncbi:MAG: hypothetical protein ACREMB_00195 [Candidatus Rokuibacteriota bacterium]